MKTDCADSTSCKCRNRQQDATTSSLLACIAIAIFAGLTVFNPGYVSSAKIDAQEQQTVTIEYLEQTQPENEQEVVEKASVEEEFNKPEPVIEGKAETPADSISENKTEPVETTIKQPKKQFKKDKKPDPKPVNHKAAPSVPSDIKSVAAPGGARQTANRFAATFTALVEKNKYYPKNARKAGITGIVKVRVSFDGGGRIMGVSVLPGEYHPSLGEAALKTIEKVKKQWHPQNGGPNSLVIPINFKLT